MAFDFRNILAYVLDHAAMQSIVTDADAQLQAAGLVYVPQTGDLTPVSASKPGAINTSAGFRCYRFDDTLQSTLGVFIRVDFKVGGAVDRPRYDITVGTGLNGSGSITGQIGTIQPSGPSASKTSGTSLGSYCSHGSGYFHWVTNLDPTTNTFAMVHIVERPHKNGAPTADGILTFSTSATFATYRQIIPPAGTVPAQTTSSNGVLQPNSTGQDTLSGSNPSMWPAWYLANGKTRHTRALVYTHSRIAELTALDGTGGNSKVSYNGTLKSYLTIGDGTAAITSLAATADALAIATD